MQPPDADPPPVATEAPRFAPFWTAICLALWLAMVALGAVGSLFAGDAIGDFREPAAVARAAVERPLLLTDSFVRLTRDELGDLPAGLAGELDPRAALGDAAELYRDVARRLERLVAEAEDAPEEGDPEELEATARRADAALELRLRGAVLAAEAGRDDWADWLPADPENPRVELARRALGGEAVADAEALLEPLAPSYSTALLGRRLAERAGEGEAAARWEAWIEDRGRALLARLGTLAAMALALGSVGLVALGFLIFAAPSVLRLDAPTQPNRWPSTPDGVGLFARYGVAFLVVSTALALASLGAGGDGLPPLLGVTALLSSLPLILFARLAWRDAPPGALRADLGLGLDGERAWRLGPVAAGGWLAAVVGIVAISTVAVGLGPGTDPFSNPFFDIIVGSTPLERLRLSIEACLWAPLFEELAFRGALFGGLRRRLRFLPSALISSALFALAHPYDAVGVLTIGWVGFVLAAVYERTRSLWAPILVHLVFNLGQLQFAFALLG